MTPERPYICTECGHIQVMQFMGGYYPDTVNTYCNGCDKHNGGWKDKSLFRKMTADDLKGA